MRLNHYWRLVATAISYATFGIGGILLPMLVIPLIQLVPGSKPAKLQRARGFLSGTFRFFIHLMRFMGVLSWHIEHLERLNTPGRLILANHPTLLDVVFLIAFTPNADCVVKGSLFRNPAMRGYLKFSQLIPNDNGDLMLSMAKTSLDEGSGLVVFPEGTRTTPNQPLNFTRGAGNIAVRCRADITPVTISCQPITLSKEHKWYHVPPKKPHFHFLVGETFAIAPYLESSPSVAARTLTRDLQEYFDKQLEQL